MRKLETYLVTGGAGFLGQALTRRLVAQGAKVRVLDCVSCPDGLHGLDVEYMQGDIRDAATVADAVAGVDCVIHAAAALPILRDSRAIHSINVDGTRCLLEASKRAKVASFVFISTTSVYGLHKTHPVDEGYPLAPMDAYGKSKMLAEGLCESFRDGMHVTIIRPKTFLGEGRLGIFEILFDWIADGKRIPLIGNGRNKYQLLDVEDLVDAVLLSAAHPRGSDTFNIAAHEYGTLRTDLSALFKLAGKPSRFLPTPRGPAVAALWVLEMLRLSPLTRWHYGTMSSNSSVETSKAEKLLGWKATKSNQDTLGAAFTWYQAHRSQLGKTGVTSTASWNQRALKILKRIV